MLGNGFTFSIVLLMRMYAQIQKYGYLWAGIMTATLTYTLVLAAIYFGKKALDLLEQE